MAGRYQAEYGEANSRRAGDMLDLSALWSAIKQRKLWILGPTLLVLVGSFIAVNLITPRYTGEAKLLLENRESFYTRPGTDLAGSPQIDSEAVQSQVQLIMSRDLAREAIKRLGLVGNSEFDPGAGLFSSAQKLLVMLGLSAHPADKSPEDRVFEKYFDRLLVFPVGRSRIVAIEFTSKDPAIAAKGANVIAQTYLEMQETAKKDTARGASSWLSTTIEPLRQKLAESEAKVEEYRSRAGLLVGTNNTTITSQQMVDMSGQLSTARSAQAESQAKARLIRDAIRQGRTFEIPDVANNPLVQRLIEQRVNLRTQLALESRTLLSEHPRIKELNAQLNDLESQIRSAAERTVRTLENDARIAGSRVESLVAVLDGQKKNVSDANESEVQLRALEREAKTQRDQLEQYLGRYREATARDAQNATPADARVISRAIEPIMPSFPKKIPTMVVATLAAFLVSLSTVIARELLSGRAVSVSGAGAPDMPQGPRSPAFAAKEEDVAEDGVAQPQPAQRRERVAGLLTHAGRVGQFRLDARDPAGSATELAELVGEAADGLAPRLLVLEGTDHATTSARALGRMLAGRSRCILIDLSEVTSRTAPGFSELLSGEAMFSDIIQRDAGSRLHIIHAGRAGRDAVVDAPDLIELALGALAETYDHVLVSASASDDIAFLAPLAGLVQAGLVTAGHIGNGHAVEAAYRLTDIMKGPVALVLEADEAMAGAALAEAST